MLKDRLILGKIVPKEVMGYLLSLCYAELTSGWCSLRGR